MQTDQPPFYCAFSDGFTTTSWMGELRFRVADIGELVVSGEAVVVCDPLVDPHADPLLLAIPPGPHLVSVAIAFTEGSDDERIAALLVRCLPDEPTEWSLAMTSAQALGNGEGADLGVPIDSGTIAIGSVRAAERHAHRVADEEGYVNGFIDRLEATYQHTRSWGVMPVCREWPDTLVACSTGLGDGVYPVFAGLTPSGQVAAVIIDFGLCDADDDEASRAT